MTIPAKTVAQLDAIQQALLQNIAHHESKTNPIPGYGNSKLRDANTLATTSLAGLTTYIRNMERRDEVQSLAIRQLLGVLAARQEAGKSKVSIKPLMKILNPSMQKVRQELRDASRVTGAVTGRISSFQPALQELPRKTEEPIHREIPKVFLDHRMDSFLYMLAKEGVPPGHPSVAAKTEADKGPTGEELIDAMIDSMADSISKSLGIPKKLLLPPKKEEALRSHGTDGYIWVGSEPAQPDQSPQPTKEAPKADLPQTLLTLQAQVPGLVAWLRNYAQSGECHGRGGLRLRLQEWADGVTKLAQQAATAQLQQEVNKASN